ncbi:hypothetical protein G6F44_000002 [Rhizopus delemar]|nr:hypothetical protein G6F44_000002 [Rhizopus delemar]
MKELGLNLNNKKLLETKRPGLAKHFTLEVKPEYDSDKSGSNDEKSNSIVMESGPIMIVSPEVHEDWQLVSNVESAKTPTYYDIIVSKLNHSDKVKLKEEAKNNLKALKDQPDTDWEFWASVITDFHKVLRTDHDKFCAHLSRGIPAPLRGMLWQLFSDAINNNLEEKYRDLLNEPSPYEKLIRRDLPRAFPHVDYFNTKKGEEGLFNVIKAYSLFDEQVGYCQGIHFLVGCLLLHMPEEAAFSVLVKLMSRYGLRGQFTPKMDKLHERMFQFEKLLSIHLPQVHRHLDAQGVLPSMYASQWFMTLFAYRCPLDLVFAVFDVVLVEGADKMLNFALALMKKNQQVIVCLDFESLLEFFNGHAFDVYKNSPSEFIEDAYSFDIPSRLLHKLSKQYSAEAARQEKLQCMEDDVKRKNIELTEKLKKLKYAYKTLNTEHQDVTQELVQAKMSVAMLDEENQRLKRELAAIHSGMLKVEKENEYQRQLDRLMDNNTQLVDENAELKCRLEELKVMMAEHKLKYTKSVNKNEEIKKQFLLK